MKFLAGIFAVFGLALHLRVYRVFGDPVLAQQIDHLKDADTKTFMDLVLLLVIPWVPLVFYSTCLAYSFLEKRSRWTVAVGALVIICAVPYFISMNVVSPTNSKMCLYAGGLAIFNHLSRPTGNLPEQKLLDSESGESQ